MRDDSTAIEGRRPTVLRRYAATAGVAAAVALGSTGGAVAFAQVAEEPTAPVPELPEVEPGADRQPVDLNVGDVPEYDTPEGSEGPGVPSDHTDIEIVDPDGVVYQFEVPISRTDSPVDPSVEDVYILPTPELLDVTGPSA